MNELFAHYLEGKLKPHVSEIHALEDYASAFACIAERRAKGKVVLKI
jgi:NADPH2:quinone reductase